MKIEKFDVVQLKSGGPRMTVVYVDNHATTPAVTVQWMDVRGRLHRGILSLGALMPAEPEPDWDADDLGPSHQPMSDSGFQQPPASWMGPHGDEEQEPESDTPAHHLTDDSGVLQPIDPWGGPAEEDPEDEPDWDADGAGVDPREDT